MSEEKKRNDKESMICFTPKLTSKFFVYRIQTIKNIQKMGIFKKKVGVIEQKNEKKAF